MNLESSLIYFFDVRMLRLFCCLARNCVYLNHSLQDFLKINASVSRNLQQNLCINSDFLCIFSLFQCNELDITFRTGTRVTHSSRPKANAQQKGTCFTLNCSQVPSTWEDQSEFLEKNWNAK